MRAARHLSDGLIQDLQTTPQITTVYMDLEHHVVHGCSHCQVISGMVCECERGKDGKRQIRSEYVCLYMCVLCVG